MSGEAGLILIGAAGGCGTTTLATGVALSVVRGGAACLLLELDLVRGDLAGAFGVPGDRTIADLEVVSDELSASHVRAAAYPHRSGMKVLFAPGGSGPGPWDRDRTARLVAAAGECGQTVVDAGGGWSESVLGAVQAGVRPVVVMPATRGGARRAATIAQHLPADGRGVLVLSRVRGSNELGMRAAERIVGLPVIGELPDASTEAESVSVGRWPTKRRGRLARAIDDVAAKALR